MKGRAKIPCSKSHRNLDEFRRNGKYCDINIRAQNTTMMCHRAILASVSEFFDARFQSKFRENNEEEINLPEIDPLAFESVLKFAYLGRVPNFLDPEVDVFKILKACDFLRISDLVEFCISHIVKYVSSIENVCEIFFFSCISNYPILSNALSSYIAENLCVVSQKEEFLLMPYEQLNMVMKKYKELNDKTVCSSVIFRNYDLLLDAIIRWILYTFQDRRRHFLELVSIINFEKVSKNYIEFLTNNYKVNLDRCIDLKISCLNAFFTQELKDAQPAVTYQNPSRKSALYVYFRAESRKTNAQGGILSFSKYHPDCHWSSIELGGCDCFDKGFLEGRTTIVTLDEPYNHLYCLSHDNHSFSSYSTVSFDKKQVLKSPKLHANREYLGLCGFQNNSIYLYGCNLESNAYSVTFLHYKCEVDKWFKVPKPSRRRTFHAQVVSDNKLVYLIGYKDRDRKGRSYTVRNFGCVQAFDYRVPKWLELTKHTSRFFGRGACCYLDGKIYYASDAMQPGAYKPADLMNIEVFDLVAGKWELLSSNNHKESSYTCYKIVPFENKLWIFYRNYNHTMKLVIFDPMTKTWLPNPFFSFEYVEEKYKQKYLLKLDEYSYHCTYLDTVVFNF